MAGLSPSPTARASCPRCGCTAVYRSRRRGVIERHLLPAIQLRPYRCENCDSRFYMRKMTRQDQDTEHTRAVTS